MNYQDFGAQQAWAHYIRQVRYERMRRLMLKVWPVVALFIVCLLIWK